MFNIFQSKKNYFIGVDFGTSYVKIVELSYGNQRMNLENYGWIDLGMLPDSDSKGMKFQNSYEKKLKYYLHQLIAKIKLGSKSAYVSLPAFNGLVALIDFPEMKDEDLERAIQFEAHKYIPTPLEEVSLSWDVIKKPPVKPSMVIAGAEPIVPSAKQKQPQRMQVVLVAAAKKDVQRYQNMFEGSGLDISVVELETFSLVRSLAADDMGTYLLIDIGSRATNIVLVERGTIYANRNINTGGNEITNTIAESLNISKARAEMLKKEKKDLLNSKEVSIVVSTMELINNEAMRVLNAYREKNKEANIDGIILSGGSSKMEGLDKYFTRTLGIRATIGNPWKRVYFNDKLRPFVEGIGTSFAVALGLAMRGVEEYKRK